MAITNHKHLKFILELAKTGNRIKAYRTAYPKCKDDKAASTNAGRLMKNVEIVKAVKQKTAEFQSLALNKAQEAVSEQVVDNVLSFNQKRQILAAIASGAPRYVKKLISEENGVKVYQDIFLVPTFNDIVKAVELDNRMTGDFAADRRELGDITKGSKTTERLDDNQFTQLIDKLNTLYLKGTKNGTQ